MRDNQKKALKAVDWLDEFSEDLDLKCIDDMHIDDIRLNLRTSIGSIKPFHNKIASLLNIPELKTVVKDLIQWISPIWQPKFVGIPVTASEIPKQSNSFIMDDGTINISCYWKHQSHDNPAFVNISWKVNISNPCEIWAQFINPETHERLSKVKLGRNLSGEKIFTSDDLGFNPTKTKWAISIILMELST